MKMQRFARYDSPSIIALAKFLSDNSTKDDRLNTFHRGYFENSLYRISMSIEFINNTIKKGDNYLDVGSFGILPLMVKKNNPEVQVRCLSYEGNRVGLGKDGFYETTDYNDSNTIRIDQVDVEKDPFPYPDDFFDFISCFETIEHLKYSPIAMMKEVKRVLKTNGIFILTTPNINSSKSILKMICGESPQECPYYHNDKNYGVIHPKEYTVEEVKELFYCLGFTIYDLYTIDTKVKTKEEDMIITMVIDFVDRLKRTSNLLISEPNFGDKIVAIGVNSDNIKSEYPPKLYS